MSLAETCVVFCGCNWQVWKTTLQKSSERAGAKRITSYAASNGVVAIRALIILPQTTRKPQLTHQPDLHLSTLEATRAGFVCSYRSMLCCLLLVRSYRALRTFCEVVRTVAVTPPLQAPTPARTKNPTLFQSSRYHFYEILILFLDPRKCAGFSGSHARVGQSGCTCSTLALCVLQHTQWSCRQELALRTTLVTPSTRKRRLLSSGTVTAAANNVHRPACWFDTV
jgi:hypothetical protein